MKNVETKKLLLIFRVKKKKNYFGGSLYLRGDFINFTAQQGEMSRQFLSFWPRLCLFRLTAHAEKPKSRPLTSRLRPAVSNIRPNQILLF